MYRVPWYRGTVNRGLHTNDGSVIHTDDGTVVLADDGTGVRTDDETVVRIVNRAGTGVCRIRTVTVDRGSTNKYPRTVYKPQDKKGVTSMGVWVGSQI